MDVEIETNNKGYCDLFKINGINLGKRITKVEITIDPLNKVKMILTCVPDKIRYNGKNVEIKEVEDDKNNVG